MKLPVWPFYSYKGRGRAFADIGSRKSSRPPLEDVTQRFCSIDAVLEVGDLCGADSRGDTLLKHPDEVVKSVDDDCLLRRIREQPIKVLTRSHRSPTPISRSRALLARTAASDLARL